ncbi:MAG: lysophospholipid acyltransferase family protein, partial [Bacteroidales bacterium]|nr:lysophospholipid acyltransferase family protein [Bacteroidales bacterium]
WTAYSPLSNPIFDKMMVTNRERYGFKVVPSRKAASMLQTLHAEGTQFVNCLMSDQSPRANYKYRTKFLGKDVPFFLGPEAYAKKYNLPIMYGRIKKIARSKYTAEIIPITLNPQDTPDGWITSEYIRLMEEDIKNAPMHYLWSHRRFKHASPD